MHLGLSAYVDALGWLIENQHRRFGYQPATERDLLLISAGQRRDWREYRRRLDSKSARVIRRNFFFASKIKRTESREATERSQCNVGADREIQNHAVTTSILRHISNAGFDRLRRASDCYSFFAQNNFAAVSRRQ